MHVCSCQRVLLLLSFDSCILFYKEIDYAAPRVGICSAGVERGGLKFDVNRIFSLTIVFPVDF